GHPAAAALPRGAVGPARARPAAHRVRRHRRGDRVPRVDHEPAGHAARAAAAPVGHAHRHGGDHRRHGRRVRGPPLTPPQGPPPPGPPGSRDPGLARERTALAWTRTALSFAAVGGVVLKREIVPGLILLAVAPAIYVLGRLAYTRPERHKLVTATIVAVAVVALVVALTKP